MKRAPTSVKSAVEREIKLSVDRDFRLPRLPHGSALSTNVLTSVYFDTPDLRLARARITLRYRREGRKGSWQLKLPLECGRREVECGGHAASPPGKLLELLFLHLQDASVGPVANLRTRRRAVRVRGTHGPGAEAVLDEVTVLKESAPILTFREVEIERLNGDNTLLATLEKRLRKAGATDHDGRPKVFRALGLPPPRPAEPPEKTAPAGAHLMYILRQQVETLCSRDPGVRLGGDSEDVHQMRVATRRMRSILRAARPVLKPGWEEPLRADLGWLGRRLGEARDLDVQLAYFKREAERVKPPDRKALDRFMAYLQRKREKVQHRLVKDLRRPRYVDLVTALIRSAREPAIAPTDVTLQSIAARAFKKLRKAVRTVGHSASDARWHRVRIRAKRARYAAELAETCTGKAATRFIDQTKGLQDLLGEIQDAVMAEDHLRAFTSKQSGTRSVFLAGQMVERQRLRRREAKRAFPAEWKKLKKCGKQAWC